MAQGEVGDGEYTIPLGQAFEVKREGTDVTIVAHSKCCWWRWTQPTSYMKVSMWRSSIPLYAQAPGP